MFVKPLVKYNKTTKQRYNIYQLCESYRLDGRIRHRVLQGLGKLEELPGEVQKKLLGKRLAELLSGQSNRIGLCKTDEKVERLAHYYFGEIKKKGRYDVGENSDWQTVDISSLKNKDGREIGAEWLCKQAFDQLGIAPFLQNKNWPEEKISLATTHIISRAVYPASELKTVSFIKKTQPLAR